MDESQTPNQTRVYAIKQYIETNKSQYSIDVLKQQLLDTGYTQQEIDVATGVVVAPIASPMPVQSIVGKKSPLNIKLIIIIVVALLVVGVGGWFGLQLLGKDGVSSIIPLSDKCSVDLAKESAEIDSLEQVSGCVKQFTYTYEPSTSDYGYDYVDYHTKVKYQFNALPAVDGYKDSYASDTVSYSSKVSPDAYGRVTYTATEDSAYADSGFSDTVKTDYNDVFRKEIDSIKEEDKSDLDRLITFNDYTKISVTSESKKISDKTYLITTRSKYSFGDDKKITAHTDIKRIVSMRAVKYTTQENTYLTDGPQTEDYYSYELQILNLSVQAEHVVDSIYKKDSKYLDKIAEEMTKGIVITPELVGTGAKMEVVN
ncbi:MAG: hypothetical protein WCK26_01080 [Candidatus Saccharibacteria bacterium]